MLVECKCGKRYRIKEELRGKRVKCQSCEGVMQIPSATTPVSPRPRNVDALVFEELPEETVPEDERSPAQKWGFTILFAAMGLTVTGLSIAGYNTIGSPHGGETEIPQWLGVLIGLFMTIVIPSLWFFCGSIGDKEQD